MNEKRSLAELKQLQALPLDVKIAKTNQRIKEWVDEFGVDGVYVSFSGGKDSTVLLDLVRRLYPGVEAVYCDTGLEYPEIRDFVKTFTNVSWVKPEMNFKQVILEYGYPFISKEVSHKIYDVKTSAKAQSIDYRDTYLYDYYFNPEGEHCKKFPNFCIKKWSFLLDAPFNISHKCCDIMKKKPLKKYGKASGKVPFIGTLGSESLLRATNWIRHGCNAFDSKNKTSAPLSFWTEQDILSYIYKNHIKICPVYGDIEYDSNKQAFVTTGCKRTGCMFCGFSVHSKRGEPDKFVSMKSSHPHQYAWIMKPVEEGGLGYKEVIDWINEHGNLDIKY